MAGGWGRELWRAGRNLDLWALSLLPLPCVTLEISPLLCQRGQDNNASVRTVGRNSVIDAGANSVCVSKMCLFSAREPALWSRALAASRRPDISSQNLYLTIHTVCDFSFKESIFWTPWIPACTHVCTHNLRIKINV